MAMSKVIRPRGHYFLFLLSPFIHDPKGIGIPNFNLLIFSNDGKVCIRMIRIGGDGDATTWTQCFDLELEQSWHREYGDIDQNNDLDGTGKRVTPFPRRCKKTEITAR
ncbi:unnamed protein product [Lupinus luteus]|uniref:Uncharacterized protein n=1 Tax=Lupinus luteus TaxID=3873 RepID=A0AAV1X9M9_LUPLU